jgi:cell division protein FtsX
MWLWIIILVFVVSIAIIIYSVIWNFVYYYRDEIYITKLVWGSNTFIYWPFVLQWMMYSFTAFVLNTIIFILLLKNLNALFWDIYSFSLPIMTLFLEMLMFMIIWWISWFFSSKKYLRHKND